MVLSQEQEQVSKYYIMPVDPWTLDTFITMLSQHLCIIKTLHLPGKPCFKSAVFVLACLQRDPVADITRITVSFNRQQDTMYKNPAYGTPRGPGDTRSLPTNTSATPPTYATINEKTSQKQSDAVGYENVSPVTAGVLGDKGGEGGEGSDVDYQVLEAPAVAEYEVPVPMKAPPAAVN